MTFIEQLLRIYLINLYSLRKKKHFHDPLKCTKSFLSIYAIFNTVREVLYTGASAYQMQVDHLFESFYLKYMKFKIKVIFLINLIVKSNS